MNAVLKTKLWLAGEVLVPVFFVFLAWPVRRCCSSPEPFAETVATGDLLLAGAIVLTGVTADIYYELRTSRRTTGSSTIDLDGHLIFTLLLALVAFVTSSLIKSFEIINTVSHGFSAPLEVRVWVTLLGGLATILWGIALNLTRMLHR